MGAHDVRFDSVFGILSAVRNQIEEKKTDNIHLEMIILVHNRISIT